MRGRIAHRQAAQHARLLLELGSHAGIDGVVPAVVRPRRNLVHHEAPAIHHEKLDAEHAAIVEALRYADRWCRDRGMISSGDEVVLIRGLIPDNPTHNAIFVHTVE